MECGNKKLFEGNLASIAIDLGGHLPSAESTGIAAVAAAGLNAGEVDELDLVVICKLDIFNSNSEIPFTIINSKFRIFPFDSDIGVAVVVVFVFARDSQ